MGYALGVDLGTTFTAAATFRDGRAEIASLGNRTAAIPSVVLLREDETVLTGEAADRRALTEPERVAREFKRRIGDTTPIFVGGTPQSAEALMSRLLRAVYDEVSTREGGPPDALAVSHPANWGPFKTDLLAQAVRLADLGNATLLTEPEAAALEYASTERVEPGAAVAVFDLGGGTFDAAVLRKTESGFDVLGDPEGIERLGGIDFDAAVFAHVARSLDGALEELDEDDPNVLAAVARLREECVEAKEALSTDTDASIPVILPGLNTEVRLTRSEFESMVRPALGDAIDSLRRALRSAGVESADLHAVVLVGGSSRIPLVSQLVSAELGRPVALDAHPKHAIALGAARRAAIEGGLADAGTLGAAPSGEGAPTEPAVGGAAAAGAAAAAGVAAGAAQAAPSGSPAAEAAEAGAAPPPAVDPSPTAANPAVAPADAGAGAPGGPSTAPQAVVPPQPPPQQAPPPSQPPPQQPYTGAAGRGGSGGGRPPAKKKRKTPIGVIIVGIVVILALGGGIAWALTSSGDSGGDDPSDVSISEATEGGPEPCTDGDFELLACITDVQLVGDTYEVDFETFGFDPTLPPEPGTNHLHFFLTPPFDQATAGLPEGESGNWIIWDDAQPFDGYTVADAEALGASFMCVVVATEAHESVLDTGNCAALPE